MKRFFGIILTLVSFFKVYGQSSSVNYHIVSDTLFDPIDITSGWETDTVYNGVRAAVYFMNGVKHFLYENDGWHLTHSEPSCIMRVNSYELLRSLPSTHLCDVVHVNNFSDTINGQIREVVGGVFYRDTFGVEDFGTIIKSNDANIFWRRKHNGILVPDWWENMSDSKKIQQAVNISMNYGKIQFLPREYIIENDINIDSLQHIHFDGQKAILKAANGSVRNATLASPYSQGAMSIQVSNVPSSWAPGDILIVAINNTFAGSSQGTVIDSIVGNTVHLKFPFVGHNGNLFQNCPAGTNIVKSLTMFRGRPSATEGTTGNEGANKGVIIENFIFDGNKQNGNTVSLSWAVNNMILLHGRGSEVRSCRFINAPSEVISGHGINVHDNVFRDCNGSVLHLSAHDATFNESYPAYFTSNTVINCNTTPYNINGHNEGIISFSWNGGYVIVSGNYMVAGSPSNGVIGSLQGYGQENDREIVILSSNYCKGFPLVVFGSHQTSTRSLEIIGNIFEDCAALMPTITNNSTVKICGNVQVGSTNFGIDFRNSCEYQTIIDQSLGLGKNALINNVNYYNTAVGHYSMQNNTIGDFNVAIGHEAFKNNINGSRNMAIGTWTGLTMSSGDDNAMLGHWARGSSTGGNANTHIGVESGRTNNGNGNVFIGYKAGAAYQGNNNLVIHNNESTLPLIEGRFDEKLTVNGDLIIGGNNFLRLPRLNTTARDQLSNLIGGEIIFNITLGKIQLFDGTNWIEYN